MDIFDTFFNVPVLIRTFPLLMSGLWITVQIGVVSIIAGLVLGMVLALVRRGGARRRGRHGHEQAEDAAAPNRPGRRAA